MTKQRNRVNLTLDDELFATLTELSELSGTPRAAIINELLTEVKPQLDLSIDLIKKLRANEMQMSDARMVFNNLIADAGDVINQAQGDINRALREINKPDEESDDNATDNGKVINVFTTEAGKGKDGTEYAERHKVQLMGQVALPNGDVKMDLMDLTIDDLAHWNDKQNKTVSIDIGAFAPSKGNIIYFVSKGSKPQLRGA